MLPANAEESSQGLFDTANFGLTTINYLSSKWYTYIPGRGRMPDEDCALLGREAPCGYRPGDINPYGLRIGSLKGGSQDSGAAIMQHLPQAITVWCPPPTPWQLLRVWKYYAEAAMLPMQQPPPHLFWLWSNPTPREWVEADLHF